MSKPKEGGVSRRELLTFWRRSAAPPPPPTAPPSLRPPPLRPPGAASPLTLASLCIRCGHCVSACPADAIFALDTSWGDAAGTPAIVARTQPCVLCVGLQCTHVCPSGALEPLVDNAAVKMGSALLDAERCLPYQGVPCDACHAACPVPGAIEIGLDGLPWVEASRCVGCGLCERACPVEPTAIRVVPT